MEVVAEPRDYAQEEISLQSIVVAAPWDWESFLALGDALLRQEKFQEGGRAYASSAETNPKSARAWGSMGKALCYLGNFEGAKEYLEKGAALDSLEPSVLVGQGLVAYKDGDLKLAKKLFERATSQDPHDVDAWFHLGQVFWELGKMGPCAEAFHRSLLLDPDNLVALRTKGNAHFALKQYSGALEMYQRIVEIDPTIETIHYGIGTLLVKLRRDDEAVIAFEKALAIDPSYGEAAEAIVEIRARLA